MTHTEKNTDKIKYTITANVPGSLCNLRCEYCYVSNCYDEENETHLKRGEYKYSLETMLNAFSPKRLGGICAIGVIGSGETLYDSIVVDFVHGLLKQGHFVTVVSNLTLDKRIDELLDFPEEYLKRLMLKGSLYWNELKRLNKVDNYFNNIKKALEKGCSAHPSLAIGDCYVEHLDEIISTSMEKLGVPPHCTPVLVYDEKQDMIRDGFVKTSPKCDNIFIEKIDGMFKSKVFDLCAKWVDIDPKEVFCYAGKWSFCVNIGNGNLYKCHSCPSEANFFENLEKMPKLEAIGKNCQLATCALQYDFIAQGLIPEQDDKETTFSTLMKTKHEVLFNEEFVRLFNFKYYNRYEKYKKSDELKKNKLVKKQFLALKNPKDSFLNIFLPIHFVKKIVNAFLGNKKCQN